MHPHPKNESYKVSFRIGFYTLTVWRRCFDPKMGVDPDPGGGRVEGYRADILAAKWPTRADNFLPRRRNKNLHPSVKTLFVVVVVTDGGRSKNKLAGLSVPGKVFQARLIFVSDLGVSWVLADAILADTVIGPTFLLVWQKWGCICWPTTVNFYI
jgi:hypothetical protein